MTVTYEGQLTSQGLKLAIVASRFNGTIVDLLIAGAIDAFVRTGGKAADVTVVRAPGAFELGQVTARVLARGGFDAVVVLGVVIRGATPHFEYVAGAAAKGVADLAEDSEVPISFGVLTTETIEQAMERAGTKMGNKGADAALAAIEMVSLFRALGAGGKGRKRA
jgi:6,7-dimethyl-8-ribityllumazine synthase